MCAWLGDETIAQFAIHLRDLVNEILIHAIGSQILLLLRRKLKDLAGRVHAVQDLLVSSLQFEPSHLTIRPVLGGAGRPGRARVSAAGFCVGCDGRVQAREPVIAHLPGQQHQQLEPG